jgi:hypothetical protein
MPEDKQVLKVDQGASGVKTVKMDFPSNSHKKREEKEEPKKLEKVVSGTVVTRKKSLGKRFLDTFIADDVSSVSSYIVHDVLVPAAKSTISELVETALEMLLFGEKRGTRTRRDQGRSYVSYNNYSQGGRRDERDRRDTAAINRARHNFDDIILASRGEAEEVLSHLVDLTIDYGQASLSDLYDLVGITGNFTDNKYGWTDLSSASVSRVRDGYMLNLPKATLID